MKKTTFIIAFLIMTFSGFSQDDWFGFNRYRTDNERIVKSGTYPEVVFMGNSITENWAYYHPGFFSSHNYCGRGIGINLHPKAVVIMAGTNDVAHNTYWVDPGKVVDNVVAMCLLARANGIVPIISSIPPCAAFRWNPEIKNAAQTIVDINKKLRAYADANGIVYVDYHTALADKQNGFLKQLSDDGCHPNSDTYFIMEELVLKAISEAVK